jgi:hypothetical protein
MCKTPSVGGGATFWSDDLAAGGRAVSPSDVVRPGGRGGRGLSPPGPPGGGSGSGGEGGRGAGSSSGSGGDGIKAIVFWAGLYAALGSLAYLGNNM